MLDIYYGEGGNRPCPLQGRWGEDYANQCAMRHSLSVIKAGHNIDRAKADRFAPGGFFTYRGECIGNGAAGRQLARGAMNWWNYLTTTGIMRNIYSYERLNVPEPISERNKIPFISMQPMSGDVVTDWLNEGEMTPAPARIETIERQWLSEQINQSVPGSYIEILYQIYQSAAQSWEEREAFERERERYIVAEGVWPRLLRKYLRGELSKSRGFVYYALGRERPSNPGYHIDGFDFEYFLEGKINHPVLGTDYSTSVPIMKIGMVE